MLDHLPTMAVRRYRGQTSQSKNLINTFSYWDMKRLDAQKFVDELSDAPWDSAFEDTDDIVDSWYKFLLSFLIFRYLWKRKEWKKKKPAKLVHYRN